MTIRRIVPNIPSSKFGESKKFYGEFLGLTLAMDMEWILTFVSDSNPTAQVSVVKNDHPENGNMTLSIEVADVDALYQKAQSLGYEIVYDIKNEPWGVRRFFVKDPNGVVINLITHI